MALSRAVAIVLTATSAQAIAAEPPPPALPEVQVKALRDPVEKSYRRIVSGMDLFARRHDLAPGASLRFKLLPRDRTTNMENIALNIVSDSVNIPVPIAPDNTFVLERVAQALKEDAVVSPNRRARSMTWRTDIRTPGLPPDTRRLGDLRLECLVGVQADLISPPHSIIEQMLRAVADHAYCEQRVPEYLFFAERPLWSVTLVYGNRREALSIDYMYGGMSKEPMTARDFEYCDCAVLIDRTYYAPLGDRSWPDDTLLVLEYMDDVRAATP